LFCLFNHEGVLVVKFFGVFLSPRGAKKQHTRKIN
jgi:hypothetical protein